MALHVQLLGPVAVERDGVPLRLAGPKQRAVLALLALRPGSVVSADRIIDALWGDEPPRTAATALQGHISQLRRLLPAAAIATRPPGYALDLDPDDVDARRFARLVEAAREQPPAERARTLRGALGLWRGHALADVADAVRALHEEAERLEQLRLAATEELFQAELSLARHAEAVPELEAFVRAEPLRGRAVGQLMLALYRSGRQADALAAYRRYRAGLAETLGLDPDQDLHDLECLILRHDPSLAPPAAEPRPGAPRRLPLTVAAVGLEPDGDADLDAEAYAHAGARAREVARLALERHGGVVERAGAALLGRFGVPSPHEDDAARAVLAARAALEAVDALRRGGGPGSGMRARAGVATGESFAGESPAVEQALRLQAAAAPGELVVDEATSARARPRQLALHRPLAGRAAERDRLRELYDASVRDRRSAFVTLAGPAGIGKSRLAEDLAAAVAPAAEVLRARCLSYGDGIGLLPAAELVRAAAGLAADATADAARARLAALLSGDERTAAVVDQLLGVLGLAADAAEADPGWAVRRLLEARAADGPLLVLVEDLHWAAPGFREITERLADPVAAPLVVVATAREAPDGPPGAAVLDLAPLPAEACADLVAELLGGEVEDRSLSRLVERSGGNPLYLEELVLDLRASGRLRAEGTWRLDDTGEAAPPSLQSLLATHVERLPEPERDLLGRCAVLGRSFTLVTLAAVTDDDPADPLAGLERARLLQPATGDDDLEFRHALIRDAAYGSLPLALRADLHERLAAHLDGAEGAPPEHEPLAVYHLDQAVRARSALAPDSPRLAAARAALAVRAGALGRTLYGRGDAAAASRLLARAVELAPGDPLVAVTLGRARLDTGELPGADAAFALAADGPLADRARLGRLEVHLHTDPACDLDAAGREVAGLLDALRSHGDDAGTAEALLASAYVSLMRGRVGELAGTLDEALALARRAGRSRAEAEMLFLQCGACWYGPDPVVAGIRRCERVLAAARDRPIVEAAARQSLGVLRAMRGEYAVARELVETSRAIRREIGQVVGAAASAMDAGVVELLAGEHAAAERVLRDGYAALERLGETGYFSTLAALLAEAVEAQGRVDEARDLARAAATASADGDAASQVTWRLTEARALARIGAAGEAHRVADEAVRLADATDLLLLRGDAWAAFADVAAARGDAPAAGSARSTAVGLLERKGLAPRAIAAWARVPVAVPAPRTPRPGGVVTRPAR